MGPKEAYHPSVVRPSVPLTTLRFEDLPNYARRKFVLTGYRPIMRPNESIVATSLWALFSVHNETMNVWSHLLGAIWFACCYFELRSHNLAPAMSQPSTDLEKTEATALVVERLRTMTPVFSAAAVICLSMSSIAHLMAPVSPRRLSRTLWTLDSLGISMCILSGYFPAMTFGFRCLPAERDLYTAVVVLLSLASAVMGLAAASGTVPYFERVRVLVLVLLVLFGLWPLFRYRLTAPPAEIAAFVPLNCLMFVMNGLGLTCYATKWPESRWPGAFDLRGGSHLLWHLATLSGLLCYQSSLMRMIHWFDDERQGMCDGWA